MLFRLSTVGVLALALVLPSTAASPTPSPAPSSPQQSDAYSETPSECYARCAVDFDRCIAAGYDPDRCYDRRWGCEQGDCTRAYTPTPEPQPEPYPSYKDQAPPG